VKGIGDTDSWEKETEKLMSNIKAKLTTKEVGERAQGVILAQVMKYGYIILIPFGEGRRYDMVIEKDRRFFRLQCKAGWYENGVVKFNTCSVYWWAKTKKSYTREEVDYFAVYCEHTGKVYLVPPEDVGTTLGFLRVEPTASNQTKRVRWAKDYEI
jgi:hypothetical protein